MLECEIDWTFSHAGWLHLKLVEKANGENLAAYPNSNGGETKSGVGAAIERLEGQLAK